MTGSNGDKKVKILQIFPWFFLDWSPNEPAENYSELSKSLSNQGCSVTIYTSDIFNKRNAGKNYDPKIFEFPCIGKYPFFLSLKFLSKIKNEIKQFDLIHVHEYRTFFAIVVHHYAKKNNVKYVIQCHGAIPVNMGASVSKYLFDIIIGKQILKDADKVIAITRKEINDYSAYGVDFKKIELVPNGIRLSDFQHSPEVGQFREKMGILSDDKFILYVGRIDSTKGLDLLIESIAEISKKFQKFRLVIVGKDFGCEQELKELVIKLGFQENVIFTGFIEKEEKISALVDADVFVTPSFSGFPHTFLEACAFGLPIITTNRYDTLDWIDNNVGFIVNYNQSELAGAIVKLLENDDLQEKFSIQGRKLVKNQFNWEIISQQLIRIYNEAIEETEKDIL